MYNMNTHLIIRNFHLSFLRQHLRTGTKPLCNIIAA